MSQDRKFLFRVEYTTVWVWGSNSKLLRRSISQIISRGIDLIRRLPFAVSGTKFLIRIVSVKLSEAGFFIDFQTSFKFGAQGIDRPVQNVGSDRIFVVIPPNEKSPTRWRSTLIVIISFVNLYAVSPEVVFNEQVKIPGVSTTTFGTLLSGRPWA